MLEGITVLNTINLEGVPTFLIIILILILVFSVGLFVFGIYTEDPISVLAFLTMIISIGLLSVALKSKPETRYEVTINDSVNVTEFCSKYEIIEQREDIYTIRELPTE